MANKSTDGRPERLETLEGVLDRISHASESGDFVVARLGVAGRREPVTVVGLLPRPRLGETLVLQGRWEFDKRFGEQFRFESAEARAPSTVDAIEKYLSSNLIRGIGPAMARRITAKFGERTLDVVESSPEELRTVSGIGPVRADSICTAFRDQKAVREVMLFLQGHGVSPAYAARIYKRYGQGSIQAVSANPYRLAVEIRGIGFRSADKIAASLGIDMRSPFRAGAGILHVLDETQGEGHVCYPLSDLLNRARDLLAIDLATLRSAFDGLVESRLVVVEAERVYSSMMATMENSVAARTRQLMLAPRFIPPIKVDAATAWIQTRTGMRLSDAQKDAIAAAIQNKVQVITGGPGTGKTTLLKCLIAILEAKKLAVALAAPTGRAAKRLSEATDREARTMHRLLEYSPSAGGFQRNSGRPLEADWVIVDEASMVDISLMHHLVAALSPHTTLLMVGDADQLPSVGPGNVLGDLISSGKVPVVRLNTVFRQASASLIVKNAHLVNQGQMPRKEADGSGSDFFLIEKEDPEDALRVLKEIVAHRIPERFGFEPITDVQVLSPMHKGTLGTQNLNRELQSILNPGGKKLDGDRFRIGDRVMQTRNNYDKEVFNGDVGRIVSYDPEWKELTISFDDRDVLYHVSELDEVVLAYAASVHKSQGSEYRAVIITLSTQHYMMLRRNLLYTAMTRGKELVVLIASPRALQIAVENKTVEPRHTALAEKL